MAEERSGNAFGQIKPLVVLMQGGRWGSILSRLFLLGGFLMVPVCAFGLLWQKSFIWEVCPQALLVMFLRQGQHAYDSLGAADIPDLTVAVLYYPLVGWILSRAVARGGLRIVAVKVVVWHVVAIGLAVGTGAIRNHLWGF